MLFIENYWAEITDRNLSIANSNGSDVECWLTESFKIIQECHPCSGMKILIQCVSDKSIVLFSSEVRFKFSDFEIKSRTNVACEATNYKELVECAKSNKTVYRR